MEGKLYLIFGDDEFLVTHCAREKIDRIVPPVDQSLGLETIDGCKTTASEAAKAIDACMESVLTPGFFGSSKITWLRDANFFEARTRLSESAETKASVARFTEWLQGGLLADQALVITAVKVNRASALYKTCKKQGEVVDFGNDLKRWEIEKATIERMDKHLLKQVGLVMSREIRDEFIQRVGFNTRTIVSELEKLRLFIHPRTNVTGSDIREICSIGGEAEVWDMLDALGRRDAQAALVTLNRLSGVKGVTIMLAAMFEKHARDLLILRECHDRGWLTQYGWKSGLPPEANELLSGLPINPEAQNAWMIKKNLAYALNYTLPELRRMRGHFLKLREKLVSSGLSETFLLETTLLRVIGKKMATVGAGTAKTAGVR